MPGVREVVERFGERLKQVSLLGPDSLVAVEIRKAYAPLVTGVCRVEGELVYATSAEPPGEGAARGHVTLRVKLDGEWRISAVERAAHPDATSTSTEAADVLRRYYDSIDSRDFRRAYQLLGDRGGASGQTFEAFAAGFAESARVDLEIGRPGRVEPAAGSWYVEVPVAIRAVTTSGDEQRFEGKYTLRRGLVEGAPAEQRRWHIYDASIVRVD